MVAATTVAGFGKSAPQRLDRRAAWKAALQRL